MIRILVLLMVASLFAAIGHHRNQTCECYKPVFLMHGLISSQASLLVLEKRIRKVHPGTIVINSNAHKDVASLASLSDQINGKVRRMFKSFSDKYPCGIIVIGYSQGCLIARALIESYLNHNVHVLILIAGPNAGLYGIPFAMTRRAPLAQISLLLSRATTLFYNPGVQKSNSVSNYWRDPHRLSEYFELNNFLPYIDNEIPSAMSPVYKAAFQKIRKLVAIGGSGDGVLYPYQSSFFSFYNENGMVVNYRDRDICKKDLFGLCTLDSQGRYIIYERSGIHHLVWPFDPGVFKDFILPHLERNPSPCRA